MSDTHRGAHTQHGTGRTYPAWYRRTYPAWTTGVTYPAWPTGVTYPAWQEGPYPAWQEGTYPAWYTLVYTPPGIHPGILHPPGYTFHTVCPSSGC